MLFNPTKDIPDLSGKVIVVTGGSSGLGKESVHQLAKHNPDKIYLAARTSQRGNAAIEEIVQAVPSARGKIHYLEVDMASFASVNRAAARIIAENERLDILMNNAGLADAPSSLSTDGYEIQFGSNYMGPALFTQLLLPLLQKTAEQPNSDVRIINLSSELFKQAPKQGILFADLKSPMQKTGSITKYGQSKLANYLFTKVWAEKYPDIKSVALHPGVVNTGVWDNMFSRPYVGRVMGMVMRPFLTNVHDGAKRQLWASTAKKSEVRSGAFYMPNGGEYTQAILKNDKLAKELWAWTEKEFAKHGY
ncbi:NAD(P)-binding protein [Aureobasidium sp. EXF-10728]|nr:NAD(P)-binding protein [Aureobasidium sp. EXF-10728]